MSAIRCTSERSDLANENVLSAGIGIASVVVASPPISKYTGSLPVGLWIQRLCVGFPFDTLLIIAFWLSDKISFKDWDWFVTVIFIVIWYNKDKLLFFLLRQYWSKRGWFEYKFCSIYLYKVHYSHCNCSGNSKNSISKLKLFGYKLPDHPRDNKR